MPMTTKLDRGVTYYERIQSVRLHDLIIIYARLRDKLKTFISITTIPLAAKLGKFGKFGK